MGVTIKASSGRSEVF